MELKIYDKQGLVKMTVSPDNSSQWSHEVGVENVVTVNFTTWEFLVLEVGWYILVEGQRFSIKSEYRPKHIHDTKYTYNLKFYGREHDTQDILFCRLNQGEDDLESVFAYDGTPMDFLLKVVANMNRNTEGVVWKAGEAITSNRQTINFNGLYCWDALSEIVRIFGTEWWIDGEYLNISKCERGEYVSLGYGHGLKSGLSQNENTNAVKWFTRLIPVGSSKNIDKNKYGYTTLQLPGREKYIDINTQYGLKEYREEAAFSEIYPHRVGTISSVRSEERTNEETGNYTVYYVKDSSLPFNPDEYMIGGEVVHMTFNSGTLSGKEFEVNWNNDSKEFEIINQYPDENTQLPGGNLIPSAGDTYVLTNISMPWNYIEAAEIQLKEAVEAYLSEYSKDISVYSGNTDYIYIEQNNLPLLLGQRVRLLSELYFDNGERNSRITRVSRKLNNLGEASIDCAETISSSWKSSVDSTLNQLMFTAAQGVAQAVISILKTGDTEAPSDYNVFSAKRSLNTFLSKINDDTASGLITFMKGIISRGQTETDDVIVNEAIHSKEFVSGFTAGKGWAIRMKDYLNSAGVNEKRSVAEFDDLIVRGTLKVFEFVVSQMLGENDNRTFTGMMEVDHYDKESGMVYFDTKDGQLYNPFRKDDIIIVQQYGGMPSEDNGYYITKQYELVIESVGIDWVTFRNFTSPMEGATEELIVKGDTFVRIDNLTDARRKGIMQIMTVGEDTPYMDVIYGKKTDPDNALKVRMGKLEGIYNHLFGWLNDFGAYIANLYAVGEFRIAHTGEDVSDKIEMTKGAFRTNFNQAYYDITSVDNHLKNGSFSGDMEGWVLGETDTDFLVVNGIALYANRNLMTANSKFAGRAVYNDKDMMRVRNSHIMQYNSDVKPFGYHKEYTPMDGSEAEPSFQYKEVNDKAYLSMRFHCNGSGTLEVGFDTTDTTDGAFPFTVMEVQKRVESYQLEASGIWSGEGNFVIRCSGDVYIEYVSLTDKPIDNLMVTTRTWIEQDAGRIALLGEKINNAQGTMTNLGIELNAVEERLNLYVTKADTHESQISQLQIDTNGIRTTVASVQGALSNTTATANSALSKAQEALWDAQDAAYDASVAKSNAATALNQSSNAIDILAVNFDDNGNVLATSGIKTYVDGAISGIKLTADNVNINNGVVIIDKDSATIGGFIVGKHTLVNEGLGNDSYGMKNTVSLTPYDGRSVGHTSIEINAMSGGATSSAVTGFSVGIKSEIASVKDENGTNNSNFSTVGGYFEGTATSGNMGSVGVWGKSQYSSGSPYILAGVVGTELASKTGYTKAQAGVIGFSQYNYGVYAKGGRNDLFLANASIGNFGIGELVTNATSMANFVNDYNILMSDSDATLPRCGDVPMGRMFLYINGDSSVHKVSRSGSDTIAVSTGASSVTSINVYENSAVFFIKIGYSKWYAFKAYDENE